MDKHKCPMCGYTYDTKVGDEENGIPSGTPWNEVPENWACPVCQGGKGEFYQPKQCKKCA